ncbi:glycosyltransferase family 2 protein [Hypericibacter sp.]|uniref:glycosyltransferase family 2 protein n=1 Tax=Hypericibacter sp. TaxID=2705401 RepID=UPI003D6D01DE
MQYSLVIPAHNEADNLPPLLGEILVLPESHRPIEIILADDGSRDRTSLLMTEMMAADPRLRLVRLPVRSGQSAAMLAGVKAARSAWVATIDADGENDPADLPRLIDLALASGADLIGGLRQRRKTPWSKQVASRLANGLRRRVLNDGCSDSACGLKLFRRTLLLQLPSFNGMHRFLPALVQIAGGRTRFIEVNDRPRRHGRSNYGNLGRAARGLVDLWGVFWLQRRSLTKAVGAAKEGS